MRQTTKPHLSSHPFTTSLSNPLIIRFLRGKGGQRYIDTHPSTNKVWFTNEELWRYFRTRSWLTAIKEKKKSGKEKKNRELPRAAI